MLHTIEPSLETLHGHFSADRLPVLTIDSGDSVRYRTIDSSWHLFDAPEPFVRPPKFPGRDQERDPGHALHGPVAVRGASPGMALEVRLKTIRPARWGWTVAGGWSSPWNDWLGLSTGGDSSFVWQIDPDAQTAVNQHGHTVRTRPFLGVLGMPPAEPGRHSTVPPRPCGGNIDCKELVAGSTLYLPIAVDGALFSLGDGHAVQGDGEVAGPALECPMECVEVELHLRPDLHLRMPRAETPAGWITFGFDQDLHEATMMALDGMLDLIQAQLGCERKEALALASLTVDLHITQIVNMVRGVHAILPHGAISRAAHQ